MAWANVRRRVVVDVESDPREAYVLALTRSIMRRIQGVGLHLYVGADGDPETSYGGSHAPQVQPEIIGAAMGVNTPSITKDLGGADIATGLSEANSGASRMFAERLRRGRVTS